MTFYRVMIFLSLPLASLLTGCATSGPQVNTWRDTQFSPTMTNTIAMTDRPKPTAEDAQLGQILVTEMQRAGFDFVPAAQADYLLTYVTDNLTDEQPYLQSLPQESLASNRPLTPQTSGQILETYNAPSSRTVTLKTFVFRSKEISLYLYTNPQKQAGGLKMVWQETITAGKSVTAEQEHILVRTLLDYFGKNHSGRVDLAQ